MKAFGEIKIVVDETNEKAVRYQAALELEFKKREAIILGNSADLQLVIVLGGDGTMLKTAHAYNFRPTFLGINCGHKGFLMNDGDPSEVVDRILDENFKTCPFPLLKIESESGWKDLAMNDIYFNRITGKTCKVNVCVDGVEIAQRISGDGVVICTALGSAGYFVPAGGSAIHPELPVIGFAPTVRNIPIQLIPMIFPLKSQFEVTLLSPSEEVKGWHDGIEFPYFRKLKVRKGNRKVRLAFWKEENFTERLIRKIMKVPEV